MPTRRNLELDVIVVALMIPVLSMLQLWLRKHIIVKGEGVTADIAAAGIQIL